METSRERVTRADVAKAAGVSETIVSYVVNNNRYVAKEKRQRVEEAIRALNYRPNNMARALKGRRAIRFCLLPITLPMSTSAALSALWISMPMKLDI